MRPSPSVSRHAPSPRGPPCLLSRFLGTVDPLSVNASAGKIAAAPSQAMPRAPAAAAPPSATAGAAAAAEKTVPATGLLPVRQFETYVELSDDSDDGDDGDGGGRARRAAAAGPRGGSEVGDGDDVFFDADEGLGVGLGVAGSTDDVEEEVRAEEEDDDEEEGTDWRQSIAQPSSAASSPLGASLARALHFDAPHSTTNTTNTTPPPPPPLPRGGSRPGPASPFLRTVTRREGAAARGSAAEEEHLRRASRRLRGKAELPDLVVAVVEVRFLS